MKISKIHQIFYETLNKPKALTHPGIFLGPNWKDVINFWLYIDGLCVEERERIEDRYWDLDDGARESSRYASWNVAREVVGKRICYASWRAVVLAAEEVAGNEVRESILWSNHLSVFPHATRELIAQHKLLEQGKTLLALPLCLKS
jgi:hypothetical protein